MLFFRRFHGNEYALLIFIFFFVKDQRRKLKHVSLRFFSRLVIHLSWHFVSVSAYGSARDVRYAFTAVKKHKIYYRQSQASVAKTMLK